MSGRMPTGEEIDDLLTFLPLLDVPGRTFVRERQASGDPVYAPDVEQFMQRAGRGCWQDPDFRATVGGKTPGDIAKATLAEIRAWLTGFLRQEHFCVGNFEDLLQSGTVVLALKRLAALRAEARA
jgi:hypothetical protein